MAKETLAWPRRRWHGQGDAAADALTHGYTTAFLVGRFMLVAGLIITLVTVNAPKQQPQEIQPTPVG